MNKSTGVKIHRNPRDGRNRRAGRELENHPMAAMKLAPAFFDDIRELIVAASAHCGAWRRPGSSPH